MFRINLLTNKEGTMYRINLLTNAVLILIVLSAMVFGQDTTLTVSSGGNVGIGITNPDVKLDVSNTVRIQGPPTWPGSGEGLELAYRPGVNLGIIQAYDRNQNSWSNLYLGSGNVGIGIEEPSMSLEVSNKSLYNRPAIGGSYGNNWAYLHIAVTHSLIWNATTDMRFGTETGKGEGYVERMRITRDGNVGIGTHTPIDKFEVEGGAFTLDGAGELLAFRMRQNDTMHWTFLSAPWIGDDLRLRNELTGADVLVFDRETNNVGIRTNSPVGALDVNGSIYQRGGLLHADYVFEPEYELESVEEHAQFMWKNKHLKAIPKASADKNGLEIVEVGSHRRGIVEELEKAHIYIEQLNNKIKNMEAQLNELTAQVKTK